VFRRTGPAVPLLAAAALLTACQSSNSAAAPSPVSSPAPVSSSAVPVSSAVAPPPSSSSVPPPVGAGKVVVLDPGHNGGNASHPTEINALVPAGRGQRKACNTTGTATDAGYPEHAFNWDVALRVRTELRAAGYTVVLTRPDDAGVGPCVDQRAATGNQADAAAVVSIHADGAPAGDHGFHVEYSDPPVNAAQGTPSTTLAADLRDSIHAAGFDLSDYLGHDGLFGRADLGGLNLSTRPTVLIECGNMRNAADAATDTSAAGRQRYADAITAGIEHYLS
jgi:N-acetylmuramoyl-L-alanine amidase